MRQWQWPKSSRETRVSIGWSYTKWNTIPSVLWCKDGFMKSRVLSLISEIACKKEWHLGVPQCANNISFGVLAGSRRNQNCSCGNCLTLFLIAGLLHSLLSWYFARWGYCRRQHLRMHVASLHQKLTCLGFLEGTFWLISWSVKPRKKNQ